MASDLPQSSQALSHRLCMRRTAVSLVGRVGLLISALHLPSWLLKLLSHGGPVDERPLFNLDLLLAAIVACFSTTVGGMLLVLAWVFELMRAVAKNYHFLSVVDLLDAARFADLVSLSIFINWRFLMSSMLLVACCIAVLHLSHRQHRLGLLLLGAAVVLQMFDVLNGSFSISGFSKDKRTLNVNVAGSPAWNILHDQLRSPLAKGELRHMQGVASYAALSDWYAKHPGRSALLVLVESMGQPRDTELTQWLTKQLATPAVTARWRVTQATEPFMGATTSGELRVLCGLQGHYTRLTADNSKGCLPAKLKLDGYEALGLHGFHLRMFDRQAWWPKIGLTPWDDIVSDGKLPSRDCNAAFPGICDATLLTEAVRRVEKPGRLVYALTLDTHLPLKTTGTSPPELVSLCAQTGLTDVACEFIGRLGQVLTSLESELLSTNGEAMVVVVGDHAPPFAEHRNRKAFIDGRVPVIILEPIR